MVAAVTKYRAADGKEFDTKDEATAYEARGQFSALVGLSERDIDDVLAGLPHAKEWADAIEVLGSKLARRRIKAGDKKRERKTSAAPLQQAAE